ncbi:unnamed protein product [Notodromas monacha]|uniref:Receptor ligand binding region domain-containing protein n=1 Tax=Notodromas monacha TaxID=399045 RepID=A0A7R9BZY2_9CRUS|nr:unnamed protein product [Notodromas monacha]CAG0924413.1 unnamed protein product [Notodromas monacha]
MVQRSVAGIFGPRSGTSASHVQSMCDALGIPHVEIRWDHRETRDELSVNLYPHPESLGKAFRDVLETLRWHRFTILYSDNEGLFRLQEILKIRPPPDKELKLTIRQLIPDEDNRPLLKALKKAGETHIVLDCPVEKIYSILEQALQDFHAVETRLFKDSGTNITGLSIVDIESNEYSEVIGRDWGESRSGAFPFADDNNDFVHFSKAAEANYDAFIQEARIAPRTLMVNHCLLLFL